ncbi:MAG: hypothetical protein GY863_21475 [bacterium]|nr:hypothetical protein [bacterium]
MNRYSSLLNNINARLDLPQPTKSRILLELAADMDDHFQYHTEFGLSDDEALKKVEEKFKFTDEAINDLKKVHQTFYKKLLYRLTGQAQSRWEKIILLLTFLSIVFIAGKELFTTGFFLNGSRFIFPVAGTGLLAVFIYLRKFYSLYIKKDHNIRDIRSGIMPILFLSGVSLVLGTLGYFTELYLSGDHSLALDTILISSIMTPAADISLSFIAEWFVKCSSMVMASLLVTMITSLLWFFLIRKAISIEQAEAMFLLRD